MTTSPTKFAAIEGRWHDEQPASEVLVGIPDEASASNKYAISIPVLGSLIGSMSLDSKEVGLTSFPRQDWPPVLIPFFTFRIMVGCGLIMLALAFIGSYLSLHATDWSIPPFPVGDISELPVALYRDVDRLVHRRGWSATMGGLRVASNR